MRLTEAERAAWDAAAAQDGEQIARTHARTIRRAWIPRQAPSVYYSRHERRERITGKDWLFAAGVIAFLTVCISIIEAL